MTPARVKRLTLLAPGVPPAPSFVAGLLGVAAIGAVIGGRITVRGFHTGGALAAGHVGAGGVFGLAAVRNPERSVRAEHCAGGQLVGASGAAARCPEERPRLLADAHDLAA
jgi:hypothetical protein